MTSEVEAHGVLVTVAQAANGAVAVTIYAQTADGPVSVLVGDQVHVHIRQCGVASPAGGCPFGWPGDEDALIGQ